MWLNKALRKQEVRFSCGPVDDALSSGRKRADFNHGGVIRRYMHHDLLVIHNLLAVFVDELLLRRGTMEACGDQYLYVRIRLR